MDTLKLTAEIFSIITLTAIMLIVIATLGIIWESQLRDFLTKKNGHERLSNRHRGKKVIHRPRTFSKIPKYTRESSDN